MMHYSNKILFVLFLLVLMGCNITKTAEIQKINENHWKFEGSEGIEIKIKNENGVVFFDTEKEQPEKIVESKSSGGILELIKSLLVF